MYLRNLNELFHQMDTNLTGSITLDDFMEQMNQEDVKLNFAMLGLDATDAVSFFSLLDVDGRVELEIDEFVMGCMRFRGNSSNCESGVFHLGGQTVDGEVNGTPETHAGKAFHPGEARAGHVHRT